MQQIPPGLCRATGAFAGGRDFPLSGRAVLPAPHVAALLKLTDIVDIWGL
jgi:hypothetical protein